MKISFFKIAHNKKLAHIIIMLLLLFGVISSSHTAFASANIVSNPGFETTTGFPTPWIFSQSGTGVGSVSQDSSTFQSGSYSLKEVTTASDVSLTHINLKQTISLVSGYVYTISFYTKVSSDTRIRIQLTDASASTIYYSSDNTATTSWVKYSGTYTATTTDASAIVRLGFGYSINTFWVDDVSITYPSGLAQPSDATHKLITYGFGSGGRIGAASGSYKLSANTGNLSGISSGTTQKSKSGLEYMQNASVPSAPTVVNQASNYDKLHVTINPGANASDTKYIIKVSPNAFATTLYLRTDSTLSSSFVFANNAQTYSLWGGATGQDMIGLTPSTTYTVKVAALSGEATQSDYSTSASAITTYQPHFSLSITTDTQTVAPFSLSFGSLFPGSVTSTGNAYANIDTNAVNGANIYISGLNNGLRSNAINSVISSVTGNLTSLSTGYGLQANTTSQSAGGPLVIASPYNGALNNVGVLDTSLRQIFSTSTTITSGVGPFLLKAKATSLTKSAGDYTDTLTLIGAGNF